ncbi:MAG: hypothetical protein R2825_02065 [Saprospiraceae bacterium]
MVLVNNFANITAATGVQRNPSLVYDNGFFPFSLFWMHPVVFCTKKDGFRNKSDRIRF